jgi:hypothetical protein
MGPFPTEKPLFQFNLSKEAADHNYSILKRFGFNLADAITSQKNSPLTFGSKFKPHDIIHPILQDHPLWTFTSKHLRDGATYPLHLISDDDRNADTTFFLPRGNHKSATKHIDTVRQLLAEDVTRGYSLILPIETVNHLKNISISPIGCQEQNTINEKGEIIIKHRLTHDQSFLGPSGQSTNLCVVKDDLPPCKYGHCLWRLINYIASIRLRRPSTPIYLSKYDFDSAFCRCHLSPQTALESCWIPFC